MHTLSISDWIWEAYGSPMAMRDTLARYAPKTRDEGTRFIAKHESVCPVCKKKIKPGDEALMFEGKAIHDKHIKQL